MRRQKKQAANGTNVPATKAFNAADIFENSDSDVLDTIQRGNLFRGSMKVRLTKQTQNVARKQNTFEIHKLEAAHLANVETAEIPGEGFESRGADFSLILRMYSPLKPLCLLWRSTLSSNYRVRNAKSTHRCCPRTLCLAVSYDLNRPSSNEDAPPLSLILKPHKRPIAKQKNKTSTDSSGEIEQEALFQMGGQR